MRKPVIVVLVMVAAVLGGTRVIVHKKRALAHLAAPESPAIPVLTAQVKPGQVSGTIQTVALVQSDRAVTVAAQVPGVLLEVRFREGDQVRKGQVLARIDSRVLQDAVETARARLVAASEELSKQQAIYERDETMYRTQDISQQALEVTRAQFEAARAARVAAQRAVESARTQRSYADVTAPFTGLVTARLVEPGDLATPGKPLFALQAPGSMRMLSKLSQDSLALLSAGGPVVFSAGGKTLAAKITRIFPALDAAHLGGVETALPAAPFGLPAGATVAAAYATSPSSGLVVPSDALLDGLSETLVVRVRGGKADPVPVKVSSRSDSESTVTGPLRAGESVIVGLPSELMALTAGVAVAPMEGR